MAEEYKKPRTKKSAANYPEQTPDSMADDTLAEIRSEVLYEKFFESQRKSEEKMLTIFQSNQDQLLRTQEQLSIALELVKKMAGQKIDPDEQLALMERSQRRSVPDTSFVVDPTLTPGKRSKERQTDKLFAYCESSYIYFKEEPIEDDAGPGLKT